MRLITQPNGSAALLIEESVRMELANDIALSANWLDDHKHLLGSMHLSITAFALCEKLHNIAHALAANRAGEIYDQEEAAAGEDAIDARAALAGTACCSEEDGGLGLAGIETPAVTA